MDSVAAAYAAASQPEATEMQPDSSLAAAYADRGPEQWVYGEVTLEGCEELLGKLGVTRQSTFLDMGSGTGRIVLYAAYVHRIQSIGIELVPERHRVAERAREACEGWAANAELHCGDMHTMAQLDALAELRCGDMLSMAQLDALARATHVFCNNAVWPSELTACVVRHLMTHAPLLTVLALLKEPATPEVFNGSEFVLARKSAVDVSWDRIGWPLFLYRRPSSDSSSSAWPDVDPAFAAALESRDGICMYG